MAETAAFGRLDEGQRADPSVEEAIEASEPGRGRLARAPSDIPKRGWRDILMRVWTRTGEDRVFSVAGSMAFFMLLALFPGLSAPRGALWPVRRRLDDRPASSRRSPSSCRPAPMI